MFRWTSTVDLWANHESKLNFMNEGTPVATETVHHVVQVVTCSQCALRLWYNSHIDFLHVFLSPYILVKVLARIRANLSPRELIIQPPKSCYSSLSTMAKQNFQVAAMLILHYAISTTDAQATLPNYITLTSETCESLGLRTIFSVKECEQAVASLNFPYARSYKNNDYADVVDGCSIRGDFVSNRFSLFIQTKGSCSLGHDAPVWIPDLNGKANCLCSRYQPCICGQGGPSVPCSSDQLQIIEVLDYQGRSLGKRKYCVSK